MTEQGAPLQPVAVSTEPPAAGPALPVVGYTEQPAGRAVVGAPALPVYLVSDAELGAIGLAAGPPVPMVLGSAVGVTVATGQRPVPVYVVAGSLDPTPPIPTDGLTLRLQPTLASLYSDAGGTAPLTGLDQRVGAWQDTMSGTLYSAPDVDRRLYYQQLPDNAAPALGARGQDFFDALVGASALNIDRQNFSLFVVGRAFSQIENVIALGGTGGVALIFALIDAKWYGNTGSLFDSGLYALGNLHLAGMRGDASTLRFTLNEQSASTGPMAAGTATGPHQISGLGTAATWGGEIAEILIYNRAITDAEVLELRAYADAVYQTERARTKQLIIDGDSISRGYASTQPWALLSLGSARPRLWLFGKNGQTLDDMNGRYASLVAPRVTEFGAANTVVICAGGTNDLYFGATAATAFSRAQTYWSTVRAAGAKVVATTLLPRSGGGTPVGFEAARQSYNALVRAASSDYDALIDVGANVTIGEAGDELNTTYYPDATHLTVAGNVVYAGVAAPVLAGLL